jgi:hypothetical protein
LTTEPQRVPKFLKRQMVMLNLLDQVGQPKNPLASEVTTYHYKNAVVLHMVNSQSDFIYTVQTNDGSVFLLTEDCLVPVKDSP